jgi:hypothetical protein
MGKVHFQQIQETEAVVDCFHLRGLVASAAAAASAVKASCCWESLNNVRRIVKRVYGSTYAFLLFWMAFCLSSLLFWLRFILFTV